MLLIKIFQEETVEELETALQDALENVPPGFSWAEHDVTINYDSHQLLSRSGYSALIFVRPNV